MQSEMAGRDVGQPDLGDVRRRLDAVDEQLVDVLHERGLLIGEVIRYKRKCGMAVVDRSRADEMLARIEALAAAKGLDPRIARQVLRAVIDAFTLLEVEQLAEGSE
jgi:chorismate mutase